MKYSAGSDFGEDSVPTIHPSVSDWVICSNHYNSILVSPPTKIWGLLQVCLSYLTNKYFKNYTEYHRESTELHRVK